MAKCSAVIEAGGEDEKLMGEREERVVRVEDFASELS